MCSDAIHYVPCNLVPLLHSRRRSAASPEGTAVNEFITKIRAKDFAMTPHTQCLTINGLARRINQIRTPSATFCLWICPPAPDEGGSSVLFHIVMVFRCKVRFGILISVGFITKEPHCQQMLPYVYPDSVPTFRQMFSLLLCYKNIRIEMIIPLLAEYILLNLFRSFIISLNGRFLSSGHQPQRQSHVTSAIRSLIAYTSSGSNNSPLP